MNTTLEFLNAQVGHAAARLQDAKDELQAYLDSPQNNRFADLDTASGAIEDKLHARAHAACEGSHNMGSDKYTQKFMVDTQMYLGTLHCEYNRHDKTYYYIDGTTFTVEEITEPETVSAL